MCRATVDLLGSGYVTSYYESAASEFVQIAENYAAMEVQRAKKAAICSIYVFGLSMNCPLCGMKLREGVQHACAREEPKPKKAPKRKVAK